MDAKLRSEKTLFVCLYTWGKEEFSDNRQCNAIGYISVKSQIKLEPFQCLLKWLNANQSFILTFGQMFNDAASDSFSPGKPEGWR